MKKIIFVLLLSATIALGCAKKMKNIATIETNHGKIVIELWEDIAPKTVENFVGLANGKKEWTDPKTGDKKKEPFYDNLIFHRVIPDFMIQGGCPSGTGSGGPGYRFEDECYESGGEIRGPIETEDLAVQVYQSIIMPYLRSEKEPDSEIKRIADQCVKLRSGKPIMEHDVEYFLEKTGKESFSGKGKLKAEVAYGTLCMANSGPNTNGSQFFIVTKKEGANWLNGKHTVFGKVIEGMDVVHTIEQLNRDKSDKPLPDNPGNIISIRVK